MNASSAPSTTAYTTRELRITAHWSGSMWGPTSRTPPRRNVRTVIPSSIKCPEAADLPSGYGKSLAAAPICSRQAFLSADPYSRRFTSMHFLLHTFSASCISLSHASARSLGDCRSVKAGVEGIKVPAVQPVLETAQGFTEPLEMDDLPFPEEADGIAHIRLLYQAQDIIVGGAGFLLCCNLVNTT